MVVGIAYMYRISGGTNYRHSCRECESFMDGKIASCINAPEEGQVPWKGRFTACRYFSKKNVEIEGQMNIVDIFANLKTRG